MEKKRSKLKIAIVIILVLVAIGAIGACGNDSQEPAAEPAQVEEPAAEEENAAAEEDAEAADDQDAAADQEEQKEEAEEPEESSDKMDPDFKKTMDDYEAWFDHYCEVMKKYQENPSDVEVLTEMTDLLSEETEMLDQMNSMDQSEMNNAELAYYLEVTARIEKKLLEVAY